MQRALSLLLGMVCLSVILNAQNADLASQLGYPDMTVVGGKVVHWMPEMAKENGQTAVGPVTWASKPLENYYVHKTYTPESLRNQN